jgi:hypothetical protein
MDGSRQEDQDPDVPMTLGERIERLVLYFDVFHHPLTLAEIERFVAPRQSAEIHEAALALTTAGRLAAEGPYHFATGRAGSVARRRERAHNAELRWPAARRSAAILAQLPWVHGVLITGGLSKGSAEADDDVDFLLLVEPGAVWTLKSFLQIARKSLPFGLRTLFCTNYILDVDHLAIDDRNLFTAIELATAVPMAGPRACAAFLDANAWALRFVPGLTWSRERALRAPEIVRPTWSRALDARGTAPRALESTALKLWDGYWNKKYAWLAPDLRKQRFKRRSEIATNHLHDFQAYVLREVEARYTRAGLAPW